MCASIMKLHKCVACEITCAHTICTQKKVVQRGGLLNTEKSYPYVSGTTKKLTRCNPPMAGRVQTGIAGYVNVTSGSETALQQVGYTGGGYVEEWVMG